MKYYQEITLIDQVEISSYFIWSKLYAQIHLALTEQKNADETVNIGVAFPQYMYQAKQEHDKGKAALGKKLRLFAQTEEALTQLNVRQWLERLSDYVHITAIRPVPKDVHTYAIYKRKTIRSNPEKLARYDAKKGRHSYDDALKHYQKFVMQTDLPYIQMLSHSTQDVQSGQKHKFKLFIEKQQATASETQNFSTYGLSHESAVPEF